MTCIVGLEFGGKVWIGGDSAGVAGRRLVARADRKIFKNGAFLFGFTSSFRMGQILRYRLIPPKHHPDDDVEKFMTTDFVDAVRQCLKDYGFNKTNNGVDEGGTFLVGFAGKLFCIYDDYQVGLSVHSFHAVGCGDEIASGVMLATEGVKMAPKDRIRRALEAAQEFSAEVRAPFHIDSV